MSAFHAFIMPLFKESLIDHLVLKVDESVILGRKSDFGPDFGVLDKNVSRKQVKLECIGKKMEKWKITNQGVNAIHLRRNNKTEKIKQNGCVELLDMDEFSLLPNKFFFRFEVERELDGSADPDKTVELDDNDDSNKADGDDSSATEEMAEDASGTATDTVFDERLLERVDSKLLDDTLSDFNVELAYQFVIEGQYRKAISLQTTFDARAWVRWFKVYSGDFKNDKAMRAMRIAVLEGTMMAVRRGSYQTGASEADAKSVSFDVARLRAAVRNSVMYDSFEDMAAIAERRYAKQAKIVVRSIDCVEAADYLAAKGFNVCLLNMANQKRPGGGYKTGAGAQEENLHRRSNLFQHLEDVDGDCPQRDWKYPIADFGLIYSPEVAFFRSSEARGYEFLPAVSYYGVLSCAADFRPSVFEREAAPLVASDSQMQFSVEIEYRLTPEYEQRMRKRIIHILGAAIVHGHDAIVLSAFGCGAFRNPPKHVAEIFKKTIKEHGFHYQFKYIYFAVFDDHNTGKAMNPKGNFLPFKQCFYGKQ